MDSVKAVEKILNYSFVNKSLLKESLTKSDSNDAKSSLFEQLEFLGDSVIGLAITNYLYLTYPTATTYLVELTTHIVSNENLARVAVKHNLYQFLIKDHPCPEADAKTRQFSKTVGKEQGPVLYGGSMKAPKFLADIVESIAGAVYIDVNCDIKRFWEIFSHLLEPILTPEELRLVKSGVKKGKPIKLKFGKGDVDTSKVSAFKYLSETKHQLETGSSSSLGTTPENPLKELFESIGKYRIHTRSSSSSLSPAVASEMLPTKMVIEEDNLNVELEDAKGKRGESSLAIYSENALTCKVTPTVIVIDDDDDDDDDDSLQVCSTSQLEIETEASSLPSVSVNPLTFVMSQKEVVTVVDSLKIKPQTAIYVLIDICRKNEWPLPVYSYEERELTTVEKMFVSTVKIEIPNLQGAFNIKGDERKNKKEAQNSSAYHMIIALNSSLMSLVIKNLPAQEITEKDSRKTRKRIRS